MFQQLNDQMKNFNNKLYQIIYNIIFWGKKWNITWYIPITKSPMKFQINSDCHNQNNPLQVWMEKMEARG